MQPTPAARSLPPALAVAGHLTWPSALVLGLVVGTLVGLALAAAIARRSVAELRADLADHRRLAERLHWQADHDPLTGLPNRAMLSAELDAALATEPPGGVAILFVDLDGFKAVNDRYGHALGDAVLRATAHRLRDTIHAPELIARFGGDEFVALVSHVGARHDPAEVAESIRAALLQPIPLADGEVEISACVGVAIADRADITGEELLAAADAAMYRAKAGGPNRVAGVAGP